MGKKSLVLFVALTLCLESMQAFAAKEIVEAKNRESITAECINNDVEDSIEQEFSLKIEGVEIELMQSVDYYIDKGLALSEIENSEGSLKHYELKNNKQVYIFDTYMDTEKQEEVVFCVQILSPKNEESMINRVAVSELNDECLQRLFGNCSYSFDLENDKVSDSYYATDGTKVRVVKGKTDSKIELIEISKNM